MYLLRQSSHVSAVANFKGTHTPIHVLIWLVGRLVGWLVVCFGLNGPLRQHFSLYRAVTQREGERKEK